MSSRSMKSFDDDHPCEGRVQDNRSTPGDQLHLLCLLLVGVTWSNIMLDAAGSGLLTLSD
jgi:hypothetical protein